MENILIASLGESPIVITAMYDMLTQQEKIPISKVIVLHSQEGLIPDAIDLIQEVLKDRCEVVAEPLPFEDANSEDEAYNFLHILYTLLNNVQKDDDSAYLSLAGGRKNMSALMAILVPFFPCVRGLYHIIDKDEDSRKPHFLSIDEVFERSEDERLAFLSPALNRMNLIKIPYGEQQQVSESFRSLLYTITSEGIEDLWDRDPVQAELIENYQRIAKENTSNRSLNILLTQHARNNFLQMRHDDEPRARRFARCFELMKDPDHLFEAIHGSGFSRASSSFHFFKRRRTAERPFFHTEPQSIHLLAKKATIKSVIVSGLAIEQENGSYQPTGDELLQAYDPAEPTIPLEALIPAGASTDEISDVASVLLVPLGTTPMIATQLYALLTAQQQTVHEVVLIYPEGSLAVRNSVQMAMDAFAEEGVACRTVTIQGDKESYKDIDSPEACQAYLKTLEATIDGIHKDGSSKIELALSGGRKGMAALTMFAAQHKGIHHVYHTLITDKQLSKQVERETEVKALRGTIVSKEERNNRLFLRSYEGNGPYTHFVLFKVPVLPVGI